MSPKAGDPLSDSLFQKIKQHAEAAARPSGDTDQRAADEASAFANEQYEEIQRKKAETAGLQERNRDRRMNRKLRTGYAKSVFCYLVCYSIFVGIVLLLAGFNVCGFVLPPEVLSFLVGSTAAAAIGLVYAVTNGLFDGIGKV